MTILEYVNDEDPTVNDMMVDLVFEPIKQQFKRDLQKWDEIKSKRSEAGRISAQKRAEAKANKDQQNPTSVESVEQNSTNPTVNDNVNVTVNVNDNVIKEIYSLYPSKCPIKGSSTGKTSKNKEKIKSLLKTMKVEDLKSTIERYLKECIDSKTFIKNFGTLLNNLPDYSEESVSAKEKLYTYWLEGFGTQKDKTEEQYLRDKTQHEKNGWKIELKHIK